MQQEDDTSLELEHVALALGQVLESQRSAFKVRTRIAFATTCGRGFCIDTGAPDLVVPGWSDEFDVGVITNVQTLSDFLLGRFDPEKPGSEHVFVWTGDENVWGTLSTTLAQQQSLLGMHLASLRRGT